MRAIVPTEAEEQIALVQWLNLRRICFTHVANQGMFPVQYRAKLARMGVQSGICDILIFDPPRIYGKSVHAMDGRTGHNPSTISPEGSVSDGVRSGIRGNPDSNIQSSQEIEARPSKTQPSNTEEYDGLGNEATCLGCQDIASAREHTCGLFGLDWRKGWQGLRADTNSQEDGFCSQDGPGTITGAGVAIKRGSVSQVRSPFMCKPRASVCRQSFGQHERRIFQRSTEGLLYVGTALELKRSKGGRLSENQDYWARELQTRGWCYVLARGAGEAIAHLERLGY